MGLRLGFGIKRKKLCFSLREIFPTQIEIFTLRDPTVVRVLIGTLESWNRRNIPAYRQKVLGILWNPQTEEFSFNSDCIISQTSKTGWQNVCYFCLTTYGPLDLRNPTMHKPKTINFNNYLVSQYQIGPAREIRMDWDLRKIHCRTQWSPPDENSPMEADR